jgi:signal transduction histidine kinase
MLRFLRNTALIGIPFGLFFGLLNNGPYWRNFLFAYVFSLFIGITIGGLINLVEWIVRRTRGDEPWRGRALVQHIALFGLVAIVGSQIPFLVISLVFHVPWFYESLRSTMINIGFSVIFTTLFMGVIYARGFYVDLRAKEAAEAHTRAELARAELRALRAQIHPHFLFNTLNTIAALIPTEPEVAEEVTTRLAEVFRFVLQNSERELIPLAEELEFVRAYLDIERVRLGDRLRVVEDIDTASLTVPVPGLLLQPLVENAVRHGIGPRPDGGTVLIASALANGTLRLSVADDGVGFDPATRGGRMSDGFGLRSAEERVRTLGNGAALEIASSPGGGTRIDLRLPASPNAHHAPSR